MAELQSNREDRIELRITRDEMRLLTAAAALEGLDVASFIICAALRAAHHVIEQTERISLSQHDP